MKTKEEKREANRLAQARYRKTKKGKETQAKYAKSSARKKSLQRYNRSIKNKLNQKRYIQKPKAKKLRKLASKKYINSEKGRRYHREYQRTPKYQLYANTLRRKRYHSDSNFRIRLLYSSRVRQILKRYNVNKKDTFSNLLGCNVKHFKHHIEKQFEPWMTWENHAFDTWHIDHREPCKNFNLRDQKF